MSRLSFWNTTRSVGIAATAARKKRYLYSALDAGQITQIRNEMTSITEKAKAKAETAAAATSTTDTAPMGDM